jgi:hypothetical protein
MVDTLSIYRQVVSSQLTPEQGAELLMHRRGPHWHHVIVVILRALLLAPFL